MFYKTTPVRYFLAVMLALCLMQNAFWGLDLFFFKFFKNFCCCPLSTALVSPSFINACSIIVYIPLTDSRNYITPVLCTSATACAALIASPSTNAGRYISLRSRSCSRAAPLRYRPTNNAGTIRMTVGHRYHLALVPTSLKHRPLTRVLSSSAVILAVRGCHNPP